ncbi:ABC transporter substrate-binding protein [Paenibacillus lignilyticus]|uniref:Carbohydrate ABC transporter substrate-binding protein n=1 Tax=Paenibacillus lignilyticus TaxID=1172615 RepID=A0ABS5CDB4_9BACL|nr:ABC transporter substrate-binding protein [Paenibacillus lignilyticus]MBP3961613.1 carbohydrate ABC transporter substrate-binding protein [Paenibacillus lignilyticus]MBP3963717.1 carbohydrate ABC transporter substrate-binding protein [Paenibacillus lignilyticus]
MKKGIHALTGLLLLFNLTACSGTNNGLKSAGTDVGNASASNQSQPLTDDKPSGTVQDPGNAGDGEPENGIGADIGKKTIVFSTFFPDERFKAAKKKYEALHPNITIKLQDVEVDDSHLEAAMEKYVTTTNTELLAGKGADLIQMDLLPIDNYASHHLLADLVPIMEADKSFKKTDFFSNVFDNVRIGEGLYSMPLAFFLKGFAGDDNAIAQTGVTFDDKSWSWNDFIGTAKQMTSKGGYSTALVYGGPEYMLANMVNDNYSLFVDTADKKASFDSSTFTGLMKQVKGMFDDGLINSDGRGASYFQDIQINSPWDYLVSLREVGENSSLYAKPHAQDAKVGGYFQTYRNVAINAGSAVKKETWDFMKFMMSDAVPTPPTSAGFPINKKMFAKQIEQLNKEGTVQAYKEGPLHGLTFKVDQTKLAKLEAYVNGAVHPVERDSAKVGGEVGKVIIESATAYFSGQKSAENVAKLIQNKVTTYLNE